jgi:hypothetical protein
MNKFISGSRRKAGFSFSSQPLIVERARSGFNSSRNHQNQFGFIKIRQELT